MVLLYNVLIWAGSPFLALWVIFRALSGKMPGLAQRLGRLPASPPKAQPTVWLHAVSLGEVKLAVAIAGELRSRVPGLRCVITSSTQTGYDEARRRAAPGDLTLFPPLDYGWICRRFLRRIQPRIVIVLETELWPNLFRETKRFGAALFLVNGRISDQSFPAYRRTRFFWRRVLSLPDALQPQSAQDGARFAELGAPAARIRTPANLKYALRPAPSEFVAALQTTLRQDGGPPILVAGSTMPGEEPLLMEAYLQLQEEFSNLWMILVPRHPERCAAVREQIAGRLAERGIPLRLRSEWTRESRPEIPGVLLVDSTGELGALYEIATVAFVGGTLVPTGGHNILEPAYFARPIVIGPSMQNFAEIAAQFLQPAAGVVGPVGDGIRTGSMIQVQNLESFLAALRYVLLHAEFARSLGDYAKACLRKLGGLGPLLDELELALALGATPSTHPATAAARATEVTN